MNSFLGLERFLEMEPLSKFWTSNGLPYSRALHPYLALKIDLYIPKKLRLIASFTRLCFCIRHLVLVMSEV
jgi:hypothetical protein